MARRIRRHRLAMVSLLVLGVILTASILAKQISPFERDYLNVESAAKFLPPLSRSPATGAMHWLGPTRLGRTSSPVSSTQPESR